jgi:hypothetical protein
MMKNDHLGTTTILLTGLVIKLWNFVAGPVGRCLMVSRAVFGNGARAGRKAAVSGLGAAQGQTFALGLPSKFLHLPRPL